MLFMEPQEIVIVAALIISLAINIPQLARTVRSRNVQGFSRYTIVLRIISHACWIAYSLMVVDLWITLTATVGASGEFALLIMTYAFQTHDQDGSDSTIVYRCSARDAASPATSGPA